MKTPLLIGFLLLLGLIGGDLVLTNRTMGRLQRDQKRVTDLQAVRLELETMLRTYVDAETGQRGFLLTSDPTFLEPYNAAIARIKAGQVRLRTLVGHDSDLTALRAELEMLGARKLQELDARIAQHRAGEIAASLAAVKAGGGKAIMDEIRQRVARADHRQEEAILALLRRNQESRIWAAVATTGAAALVGSGLVVLYFFTRRNLEALEAAKEETTRLLAGERAAHSEAAQANKLKDEFLALVSHELRTPLNAMLGWTSLLREGAEDEKELNEGLETIDRNARAQARLVDDLLDVSRIISGKVRLEIAEVNLRAVTASVIDALRPAAEARGVKVQLLATQEPAEVLGDADRLQQVVWNLLSNAIKFTPRGGDVTLNLENSDSRVVLTVKDTGPGIDPDFLPRIFDRFSQGDASTTRGHGGLGLGLAISRHLVELHGGRITAESDGVGLGCTFRVQIPVIAVKELKKQLTHRVSTTREIRRGTTPMPATRLDGRRILAVDDQADTLAIVNRVLTRAGAEVRTARSAAEGLAILRNWQPDLLISDVGMPGQDGYGFIREVRMQHSFSELPALALTAFAREADRKMAVDSGFNDHLAKPVDAAALLEKVARSITRA